MRIALERNNETMELHFNDAGRLISETPEWFPDPERPELVIPYREDDFATDITATLEAAKSDPIFALLVAEGAGWRRTNGPSGSQLWWERNDRLWEQADEEEEDGEDG